MGEKKFKSNNFQFFLLWYLQVFNNTETQKDSIVKKTNQHCIAFPLHCKRKQFCYFKYRYRSSYSSCFGFQIQRHLISIYLDNQHDLKQGNQRISSKHQLLQSHRNSTNVLREQTLNLATARKRPRESQNNFYPGSQTQQKQP